MASESGRAGVAASTGLAIRRARERKRWRQEDLAAAVGVSRNAVDAWENGRTYPNRNVGRIEEVLGISLSAPVPDSVLDSVIAAEDEWEAGVLTDPDLPPRERREIVLASRRARNELYPPGARRPESAELPPETAAG